MPPTPSFEWYARVVQHVLPQHRPVSAPMHRAHPVPRVIQLAVDFRYLRYVHLQRRVRMAEQRLPQVPQAMLDVLRRVRAVHDVPDADDVQAVELVVQRDQERAVVRAERDEPVRGEQRAPLVVVV